MAWWLWSIWLVGAYLIGAIPFALLLGRTQGVDIRQVSSGNVGATNLGRALGRSWGLGCFALDVAKGFGPVFAFGMVSGAVGRIGLTPSQWIAAPASVQPIGPTLLTWQWLAIAAATILGHVFPIWIGFRGGKGVATSLGSLMGIFPYLTFPAILAAGIWFGVVKSTGYVGLASVISALAMPLLALGSTLAWALPPGPTLVFVLTTSLLCLLVIFRHRANLARLRAGTEEKAKWTGRADRPSNPTPGG